MKEERFSAFRLHKEHKGIIFLFGIFALLFSAFYLSLLVGWKPRRGGEICGVRRLRFIWRRDLCAACLAAFCWQGRRREVISF